MVNPVADTTDAKSRTNRIFAEEEAVRVTITDNLRGQGDGADNEF
jgi:hypothetical protein